MFSPLVFYLRQCWKNQPNRSKQFGARPPAGEPNVLSTAWASCHDFAFKSDTRIQKYLYPLAESSSAWETELTQMAPSPQIPNKKPLSTPSSVHFRSRLSSVEARRPNKRECTILQVSLNVRTRSWSRFPIPTMFESGSSLGDDNDQWFIRMDSPITTITMQHCVLPDACFVPFYLAQPMHILCLCRNRSCILQY
jgi:hypothetical protein